MGSQPRKFQNITNNAFKVVVQLGNTFTQSGCGCLIKCLQLSMLLPLPSHKLHTFPKSFKGCPVRTRVLFSWGILSSLRAAQDALKMCLQLSILLPLPSHKLHTYPQKIYLKRYIFGELGN